MNKDEQKIIDHVQAQETKAWLSTGPGMESAYDPKVMAGLLPDIVDSLEGLQKAFLRAHKKANGGKQ